MNPKSLTIILILSWVTGQNKLIFDPSQLIDPEPKWPTILNPISEDSLIPEDNLIPSETNNQDTSPRITEGYRVQVLATRTMEKAEELKIQLSDNWRKEIYITFEAPNYKVRIGNFSNRGEAENFRQELVKKGYPSAWIIRTRIEPNLK